MNTKRFGFTLGLALSSLLGGCVYQAGPDIPAPADVNSANNANSTNNANASNNANALNNADWSELELDITPDECPGGEVAPIIEVPSQVGPNIQAYLRESSAISAGILPDAQLPEGADLAYAFMWAHREGSDVIVTAGTIYVAGDEILTTNITGKAFPVGADEEVANLLYQPGSDDALYRAVVFTNTSIYSCDLAATPADSGCEKDTTLSSISSDAGVYPLSDISFTPYMVASRTGEIGFDLASFFGRAVFLGLGGTENQRAMGTVKLDFGLGSTNELTIADTFVRGPYFYGARQSYGYTTEAKGVPYLLTIARNEIDDSDARPAVFVADDIGVDAVAYNERTNARASWFLHPEIERDSDSFTFATAGSIVAGLAGLSIRYDLARSDATFGYIGVADGETLVFAKEEGFASGDDFLTYAHDSEISELRAGAGMRFVSSQQNYDPIVAFVSGDDRDQLSIFQWQSLGLDFVWFEDVVGPTDYTQIRQLQVPEYNDDQGFVYFRATGDSNRQVFAILPLVDAHDLETSLCLIDP